MGDVAVEADCSVHVTGGSPAWQKAIAEIAMAPDDCRTVDVHVGKDIASVIFVARDGRVAVRAIKAPGELASTIDALRISLPPLTSDEVAEPAAAASPTGIAAPPVVAPVKPQPPPTETRTPSPRVVFVAALYGGVRVAWPNAFASPLLGAGAAVGVGSWRLGVYGDWETGYTSRAAPLPSGYQLSAYAAGVTIGPTLFDGRAAIDLRLGGAIVNEEGSETIEDRGGDRAEPRLGIGAHTAIPFQSAVRARIGLAVEVAPTRRRSIDPTLPAPPLWGIALTFGFEADGA